MNELLRIRRNTTLLWLCVTLSLWVVYSQVADGAAVLALLIAAAMVAVVNLALLLVLRGETLSVAAYLTSLGAILGSLCGRDE